MEEHPETQAAVELAQATQALLDNTNPAEQVETGALQT
jgi:hypothetical protein